MQLKLIDIRYTTVAHFRQCSRICGGVGVSNDHGDDKKVAAPVPTLPVVTNTSSEVSQCLERSHTRAFSLLKAKCYRVSHK